MKFISLLILVISNFAFADGDNVYTFNGELVESVGLVQGNKLQFQQLTTDKNYYELSCKKGNIFSPKPNHMVFQVVEVGTNKVLVQGETVDDNCVVSLSKIHDDLFDLNTQVTFTLTNPNSKNVYSLDVTVSHWL